MPSLPPNRKSSWVSGASPARRRASPPLRSAGNNSPPPASEVTASPPDVEASLPGSFSPLVIVSGGGEAIGGTVAWGGVEEGGSTEKSSAAASIAATKDGVVDEPVASVTDAANAGNATDVGSRSEDGGGRRCRSVSPVTLRFSRKAAAESVSSALAAPVEVSGGTEEEAEGTDAARLESTRPVSSGLSRSRFRRVSIGPEAEEDDDARVSEGRPVVDDGKIPPVDEEHFSPPKISSLSRETSGK